MTEQITLGIKGRGQNPEKDDVIKSTDIFEKDSLIPGQEPTLREDLTLTVEPEPTVTTNVAQTATTFTEDTMKDAISLENYLWGTKLSLETALESLKETTDEFKKLSLAKENYQATTTEQFALESIGQRMKAGINRAIEFLKNLWNRLMTWIKGERGQSAEAKAKRMEKAIKRNTGMSEAEFDAKLDEILEKHFNDEERQASFTTAAAFKEKADDISKEVDRKTDNLDKNLKQTVIVVNKETAETLRKVQEMVAEAKSVNDTLKEATDTLDKHEASIKDIKSTYKDLRKKYSSGNTFSAKDRVAAMEKRLSTIEDIRKAIEKDELTPETGGAMAEALRSAAKAAKFEEERIKAESIIAETVLRIEEHIASEVAQGPEFEIGSRSTAYNSATSSEEEEDYAGVPVTILGSKKNFGTNTRSYLVKIESGRNKGFYGSARKSSQRRLELNPKNGELYITEMSYVNDTKEAFAERYDFIIGKNVDAANETYRERKDFELALESLRNAGQALLNTKFATESNKRSSFDGLSVESIKESVKAGVNKVVEYIRAFIKRIRAWWTGERGKQVEGKIKAARSRAAQGFNGTVFKAKMADGKVSAEALNKMNDIASFKQAADKQTYAINKSVGELAKGIDELAKRQAASDREIDAALAMAEELLAKSKAVTGAVDQVYQEKDSDKIVEEVSEQNAPGFYSKFSQWYANKGGKDIKPTLDASQTLEKAVEQGAQFTERYDGEPEVGNAMAQALRAAAKAAKFQQDSLSAETNLANAILKIESEGESISKEDFTEPAIGVDTEPTDTAPETVQDTDTVPDAEGTEDPGFEVPASPEDLPDSEETSLNDPEYLEGEHEGQTEEETLQVIEERAEDLAVAAEALTAQTRVLEKLKANKVISVGFVTESIQTLGENPFKDPRYYTQLPSRTNYDYSVESLGERIKDGAKNLKERVMAFVNRFWQWLMNLFGNVKQRLTKRKEETEQAKAANAEVAEQAKAAAPEKFEKPFAEDEALKPMTESKAEIKPAPLDGSEANPVDTDKPAELIYQLLGYASPEYPLAQADYSKRLTEVTLNLNADVKRYSAAFIKAVNAKDEAGAKQAVGGLQQEGGKLDKMREELRTRHNVGGQGILRIMESKASARTLSLASEALSTMRKQMIEEAEVRLNSSAAAKDLTAYEKLLNKLDGESQVKFIELIQKAVSAVQRFVRVDREEMQRTLQSIDRDFPVERVGELLNQYLSKVKKEVSKEIKDGDQSSANESLKTSTRRKRYWER